MFRIGGGNTQIHIRQATLDDHVEIVRIGARAFPYIREPESFFLNRLKTSWVFVAELDNTMVGFIDVEIGKEAATVAGIAVDERFRGGGVGTALMSYVVDLLGRLGIKKITLQARDSNLVAIRLYRKFGFVKGKRVHADIHTWYKVLP